MLTLLLLFVAPTASAHPEKKNPDDKVVSSGLELRMSTDKNTYKIGEEIRITSVLENTVDESFHVDPMLELISGGTTSFQILVYDAEGHELDNLVEVYADTFGMLPKGILNEIGCSYLVLHPGKFYGSRIVPRGGSRVFVKPGRYRLVGVYRQHVVSFMSQTQENQLGKLEYPIWEGMVTSEPVWIEIVDDPT
jgi:hypothetical protein